MMKTLATAFLLVLLSVSVFAAECKPPEIRFNNNAENIFSVQQEIYLGEVMRARLNDEFEIVDDPEIVGMLDRIGQRIVKHLPPSGFEYKYHVVDMPETNAFIIAGGYVFFTKKLIAFVESEDELAGILAHELGHGVVRHSAIDVSLGFKKILNVDSVGDREDVVSKYNEYLSNRARKRIRPRGHEGRQQIEADEIGLYAMTAAGYNPEAFSSAFDRLIDARGKTGSRWDDFFGRTTPAQKRLRVIVDGVKALPSECLSSRSEISQRNFEEWQAKVLMYKPTSEISKPDLVIRKITLKPSHRNNILGLEYSADGKLLLARDHSSIFVIRNSPYENLFKIDASNVEIAQFSKDSRSVLVLTRDLRFEKWDVASQKAVNVREIYIRGGCAEKRLSPQGDLLACFQRSSGDIRFLNLRTKEVIHAKEGFYKLGIRETNLAGYGNSRVFDNTEMEFSPSGRYFIAARLGTTFRIGARFGPRSRVRNRDAFYAYDFVEKKEVPIGGTLRGIISMPFSFASDSRIIGQHRKDPKKGGVFSFPDGKRIEKFPLQANSLEVGRNGRYLLVRPIKTAPVGVFDMKDKKFIVANRKSALAIHNNRFVSENKDGVLGQYKLDADESIGELELPETKLGVPISVVASPDLNWLGFSDRNRGQIWSTFSGTRYSYTTAFGGAYFDKSGKVFLDIRRTKDLGRQSVIFNVRDKSLTVDTQLDRTNRMLDEYLINLIPTGKQPSRRSSRPPFPIGIRTFQAAGPGKLEVLNLKTKEVYWSRDFEKNRPVVGMIPGTDVMTLRWPLQSDEVRKIAKGDKELLKEAKSRKEGRFDYYVQVVDAKTGKVLRGFSLESGRGSFLILNAVANRDRLAVIDSLNRIQLFSMADGELTHTLYGESIAITPNSKIAAVKNGSSRIAIHDLESSRIIERISFGSEVVFAQFDKYSGKLLVLTDDQKVYILDTSKFGKRTAPKLGE